MELSQKWLLDKDHESWCEWAAVKESLPQILLPMHHFSCGCWWPLSCSWCQGQIWPFWDPMTYLSKLRFWKRGSGVTLPHLKQYCMVLRGFCIALSCIDTAEMILSDSASAGQSENLKIFLLSYLYMYNPSKILPIVRHTHWEFDQNSELDPLDPTLFFFQARQNFTLAMWQLTEVTSSTCWFLFLFKHRLVNHCLYLIGLWIQDHNILNKAEWHEEISSLVLQWASSFQKLPFRLEISSFMFLSWERVQILPLGFSGFKTRLWKMCGKVTQGARFLLFDVLPFLVSVWHIFLIWLKFFFSGCMKLKYCQLDIFLSQELDCGRFPALLCTPSLFSLQ